MTTSSLRQHGLRALNFYNDREYFSRLLNIAVPVALQSFVMASLNMVGNVMVGQLGETAVAAVGLANQIFFLLTLVLFGITSGAAIFTAQLWGRRDVATIRKVLGLAMMLSLAAGLVFFAIARLAPEWALGVYSRDPQVVALGSRYLSIFGWGFVFTAITFCYASVLRSVGEVRIPLFVSGTALGLNTLLSYLLIFGKFGLPQMGVEGAALAAMISRLAECAGMLYFTYRRDLPAAVRWSDFRSLDFPFARRILLPVLPVAANELFWSMGITAYNVVYARISTEAIAAMNITGTIDNLALVLFNGIAHATAVVVGNQIGAGDNDKAYVYAARSLGLGMLLAVLMGIAIQAGSGLILAQYQVAPVVLDYARRVLLIISLLLWLRTSNMIMFVGILRSGGDTRYAFVLDAVIIWVVGVPLAFTGAFLLHLPVYWVYLLVMTEEITKWILSMIRFFSKKWIHNLASTVGESS